MVPQDSGVSEGTAATRLDTRHTKKYNGMFKHVNTPTYSHVYNVLCAVHVFAGLGCLAAIVVILSNYKKILQRRYLITMVHLAFCNLLQSAGFLGIIMIGREFISPNWCSFLMACHMTGAAVAPKMVAFLAVERSLAVLRGVPLSCTWWLLTWAICILVDLAFFIGLFCKRASIAEIIAPTICAVNLNSKSVVAMHAVNFTIIFGTFVIAITMYSLLWHKAFKTEEMKKTTTSDALAITAKCSNILSSLSPRTSRVQETSDSSGVVSSDVAQEISSNDQRTFPDVPPAMQLEQVKHFSPCTDLNLEHDLIQPQRIQRNTQQSLYTKKKSNSFTRAVKSVLLITVIHVTFVIPTVVYTVFRLVTSKRHDIFLLLATVLANFIPAVDLTFILLDTNFKRLSMALVKSVTLFFARLLGKRANFNTENPCINS